VKLLGTKGQAMGSVTAFVALAMIVIVGAIVFSEFDDAADTLGLSTAGQAAVDNVTQNTYSGFN